MRYLLDTNALIWYATGNKKLRDPAKNAIADRGSMLFYSMVSVWEVAIKFSLDRFNLFVSVQEFQDFYSKSGFKLMAIKPKHAMILERLPFHHRCPFDRMLIAQAMVEKCALISSDRSFQNYEVEVVW